MTHVEPHDGFDRALAAVPACSLNGFGAPAQKERYTAVAPFATRVSQQALTLVVEFAEDVDSASLDEVVATEQHCCRGLLSFELDRSTRSLKVTAPGAAYKPAVDLIATEFRRGISR